VQEAITAAVANRPVAAYVDHPIPYWRRNLNAGRGLRHRFNNSYFFSALPGVPECPFAPGVPRRDMTVPIGKAVISEIWTIGKLFEFAPTPIFRAKGRGIVSRTKRTVCLSSSPHPASLSGGAFIRGYIKDELFGGSQSRGKSTLQPRLFVFGSSASCNSNCAQILRIQARGILAAISGKASVGLEGMPPVRYPWARRQHLCLGRRAEIVGSAEVRNDILLKFGKGVSSATLQSALVPAVPTGPISGRPP